MDVIEYIERVEHYVPLLEGLGYEVGTSNGCVLYLYGWGISTYLPLDEVDALDSMVDLELHADRVYKFEHPENLLEGVE